MYKLSAKCLTYGRTNLIVEAIYSFLQQNHKEGDEMVIVNDYPLQTLIFDHPKVKIYNLDKTFDTIGEKENFAIEKCSGDLICTWDDDDIALPWHFDNIRKFWKEDTNILHWANGVYYNEPEITKLCDLGNSGMVFSKKAWEDVGRSPKMNAGGDSVFRGMLHKLSREGILYAKPPDNEVSWFYRWGSTHNPQNGEISIFHQSGAGTDHEGRPNIIQRHSLYIEKLRLQGYIPTGDIYLEPKWKRPYDKMLEEFINKK